NPHALANAKVLEAMFPGDPEMKFRTPYDMGDPGLLRELLAGAGFRATRIETKRIAIVGAGSAQHCYRSEPRHAEGNAYRAARRSARGRNRQGYRRSHDHRRRHV